MPLIHFKPIIDGKGKHGGRERDDLVGPASTPKGRFVSTANYGADAAANSAGAGAGGGGDAVRQHFVRLPLYKSDLRASVNPGTGKTSEERLGDVIVASTRSQKFWLRRGSCFVAQIEG